MKRIIFTITVLVLFTVSVNAQRDEGPMRDSKFREKMEQLEKIKLIEVLKLDEETTLRFFSRQNKSRDEMMKFEDQKNELVRTLENYFTAGTALTKGESFESLNKKILELERKMLSQRTEFIKSLNDLLTAEQISKFIVFESSFRREIRDMILDKRGGGPPR